MYKTLTQIKHIVDAQWQSVPYKQDKHVTTQIIQGLKTPTLKLTDDRDNTVYRIKQLHGSDYILFIPTTNKLYRFNTYRELEEFLYGVDLM